MRATRLVVLRALPSFRMLSISWRRVILAALGYFKTHATAYFEGSFTVRRCRPFFLRRLRTARPHRVDMRVRNPCVRIRRLFRGRYVGFPITNASPERLSSDYKRAKDRPLTIECQQLRRCLQSREIDFSTARAYVGRPHLSTRDDVSHTF